MPGSKQKRRKSPGQLSTVYPLAAGIDVGAIAHVVAVSPERDDRPVRTFQTFRADLHCLAQWLGEVGITTVAMGSTLYWVPVFEILEARGFEVLLVNPRDVKNVPGRKTDITMPNCSNSFTSTGCCAGASVRAMGWSSCARTYAIVNA